jgi:hypothetical protein
MKKLNVLLITGLVLLFTCGTVLAFNNYQLGNGSDQYKDEKPPNYEPDTTGSAAPVPEPATMLLLGSGLVALGAGARKMKK